MHDTRPIGFFDSGVGGLTVLNEAISLLPDEHYLYIGDTNHVPYGQKSPEQIIEYSTHAIQRLLHRDIKALVIACNTVSAIALEQIKHIAGSIPIIDVIDPTIRCIPNTSDTLAVLATQATVNSHIYKQKIGRLSDRTVIEKTTSLFVPVIENHFDDVDKINQVIRESLHDLQEISSLDTIVLGCTHYPIIKNHLADFFGPSITIIDSSRPTAQELKTILVENNLCSTSKKPVELIFTAEDSSRSYQIAQQLLPNVAVLR